MMKEEDKSIGPASNNNNRAATKTRRDSKTRRISLIGRGIESRCAMNLGSKFDPSNFFKISKFFSKISQSNFKKIKNLTKKKPLLGGLLPPLAFPHRNEGRKGGKEASKEGLFFSSLPHYHHPHHHRWKMMMMMMIRDDNVDDDHQHHQHLFGGLAGRPPQPFTLSFFENSGWIT